MDYDKLEQCIPTYCKKTFGNQTMDLYYELLGCNSLTKLKWELTNEILKDGIRIYG